MSENNLHMSLTINGQDDASAMLKGIVAELEKIKRLGASLGSSFKKPFSAEAFKPITSATLSMTRLVEQIEAATVAMGRLDAAASKFKSPRMGDFSPQTAGRHVRPKLSPSTPVAHPRPGRSIGTAAREMRTGIRSAGGHTHLGSPAVAALVGTTTAVVALRKSIDAAVSIDTATSKMRMFGGLSAADANDIRAQALRTSIDTGMAPEHIINSIQESLRAGLSKPLALAVGDVVPKVAASLGESAETIGNTFGEAVQQLSGMSEGKFGPDDVRRFGNEYAGLANFGGNTAEKSKQFLDSGGLGRGRELGWDATDTLAVAAAANAKGARTGQATSRMLGQISQSLPKMHDIYDRALRAKNQTQMDRDIISAPALLGYKNIDDMQTSIKSGAGGFFKFVESLSKLEADQRKRILEGFKIPESAGAVLGELGASPGTGQKFLDKGRELAGQSPGNDYMSSQFGEWNKSLQQMLNQIKASFEAIRAEIGDVLKADVISPFRDGLAAFAKALLDSGFREQINKDVVAFKEGLGLTTGAFDSLKNAIFDPSFAEFLRGLGEGIRAVLDAFKGFANALGLLGGGGAEAIGRLTAELLGLGLACRALAPVIGALTLATEVFKALSAAGLLTGLAAFATEFKAVLALPFAQAATGLAALLGPLTALVGLAGLATEKGILSGPQSMTGEGILRFLDPGLADRFYPKATPQSFDGNAADLIHKTSFNTFDPADIKFGTTPGGMVPDAVSSLKSGGGADVVGVAERLRGANGRQAAQALGARMTAGEWCADFLNGSLAAAGIKGTGSSAALSFRHWGTAVDTMRGIRRGDVFYENHGGGRGHVGFLTGQFRYDANGNITAAQTIAGNHGGRVSYGWEKAGEIAGVRRANDPAAIVRSLPPQPSTGRVHNGDVNINVYDATDPSAVGAAVKNHLDQHMGYRTSDVGVDL